MRKLRNNYIRIILFAVACLAVVLSVWNFNLNFSETLGYVEKMTDASDLTLEVVSYPANDGAKQKMICKVINCETKELNGSKTRLVLDISEGKSVFYGDVVKFEGVLSLADTASLPGAFDYRNYLKSQGVTSQCRAKYEDVTIAKNRRGFLHRIYSVRKTFMQSVENLIPERYAGLAAAVITGDRSGISDEVSENLKIAGVYHIVAISGLHLNIFVSLIAMLLSKIKTGRLKKLLITYGMCMIFGGFVLVFTGYAVSVIRAFSMLVILFVSVAFSRDYNAKNSLVVSAIIILVFMPCNIYSTAFYLSFLSTLGVLLSVDITEYLKKREIIEKSMVVAFVQVVVTSVVTTLLTLPVTITSFGYIPLFSWLANLVILPLMAPFLAALLLFALASGLGALYVAIPAAYVACVFSYAIMKISGLIAGIPFAAPVIYPLDAIAIVSVILFISGNLWILRRCGIKAAIPVLVVFTLAFTSALGYNTIRGIAKVHFVDVGQGDCAIAELPGGDAVLIDCGTQSDGEYLINNIESFMRKRNIKSISAAFLTHYHSDHTNGTYKLLKSGVIKRLFLPLFADMGEAEARRIKSELLANASEGDSEVYFVSKGTLVRIGDMTAEVFLPDGEMYLKNNEMSAVIKMTYGESEFLFTGDAEKNAIERLSPQEVECDVLKVAHHGSKNGLTSEFCRAISPEYAVISCGKNNSYNHPSDEVIEILEENDISYFRTDNDGTITCTLNKKGILNIRTTE